jgi:hypothetical protein
VNDSPLARNVISLVESFFLIPLSGKSLVRQTREIAYAGCIYHLTGAPIRVQNSVEVGAAKVALLVGVERHGGSPLERMRGWADGLHIAVVAVAAERHDSSTEVRRRRQHASCRNQWAGGGGGTPRTLGGAANELNVTGRDVPEMR